MAINPAWRARLSAVKSIIRVAGAQEAIRVANDREYGLSAAMFGRTSAVVTSG